MCVRKDGQTNIFSRLLGRHSEEAMTLNFITCVDCYWTTRAGPSTTITYRPTAGQRSSVNAIKCWPCIPNCSDSDVSDTVCPANKKIITRKKETPMADTIRDPPFNFNIYFHPLRSRFLTNRTDSTDSLPTEHFYSAQRLDLFVQCVKLSQLSVAVFERSQNHCNFIHSFFTSIFDSLSSKAYHDWKLVGLALSHALLFNSLGQVVHTTVPLWRSMYNSAVLYIGNQANSPDRTSSVVTRSTPDPRVLGVQTLVQEYRLI